MTKRTALVVLALALVGVFLINARPGSRRLHVAAAAPLAVLYAGPSAAVVEASASAQLIAWYAGEDRARAEEAARIAEAERIEAERQAEEAARARAAMVNPVVPTGGCCGPHSDAWWHGVAICEQSGNNHPYFGYFSFMDGSQGGKPWAEQVAAGNALLARAGREVGPWAASCVAAGYASSPSG